MAILQEEASLHEIVQLVGKDSLSPKDQLTLETARIIREDFLQQNAFMDEDSHSPFLRQRSLLGLALHYDALCRKPSSRGQRPPSSSPSPLATGWAVPRAPRRSSMPLFLTTSVWIWKTRSTPS